MIHAVYLINCASKEPEIRKKSIASLTQALRVGDGIGAGGVVLHAGARKGEPHARLDEARRARRSPRRSPTPSRCPILLENTAGTHGPLGATSTSSPTWSTCSTATAGSGSASTAATCSPPGFDIRTTEALDAVIDEFDAKVGLDRLRCLHLNDSKIPLGGNRDRHAPLGEGEIGEDGLAVFLSEPRFDDLPTLIETGAGGRRARQGRRPPGEEAERTRNRRPGLAERRPRYSVRFVQTGVSPGLRETARCRPRPSPVTASATAAIAITSKPVNGSGPTLPSRPSASRRRRAIVARGAGRTGEPEPASSTQARAALGNLLKGVVVLVERGIDGLRSGEHGCHEAGTDATIISEASLVLKVLERKITGLL